MFYFFLSGTKIREKTPLDKVERCEEMLERNFILIFYEQKQDYAYGVCQ